MIKRLLLPCQTVQHVGDDYPVGAAIYGARAWFSNGSIFGPGAVIGNGQRDTVDTVFGNAGGTDYVGYCIA